MPWLALALLAPASAVTLTLDSTSTPHAGVTLEQYTTSSPSTHTSVARVDLCAAGVHVASTFAPDGLQTVEDWADDEGVQVALNGDFYTTGPTRVYGHAVGSGIAWPLDQTGRDPAYASSWYYDKYGYVAFGHDWVDFTHTEQVKGEATLWGLAEGWAPAEIGPEEPPGTLALVSGFPELVIEGQPVTCSSPTDSSCFPDRSDMRDRHPRSAVGLSADRSELILVAVDGRTSASDGMYGEELADLMHQLGAHVAFNLDGGGSTGLWVEGDGYVNDASGNNFGSGPRAVANHLGVHVGGDVPTRPGHCATEPSCDILPATGGVLDDDGACFRTFGNPVYWREESAGHGGHLYWTNAWDTDLPENWAWWQVELEEGGEYLVEYYAEPDYAVFSATHYEVLAGGVTHEVIVDQSLNGGWQPIGTFVFTAGGAQHVAVYDDHPGSTGSDQHITADAIRLTRLDLPEEPPVEEEEEAPEPAPTGDSAVDTGLGGTADTGATDERERPRQRPEEEEDPTSDGDAVFVGGSGAPAAGDNDYASMSGCDSTGGSGLAWVAGLALLGLRRRR